MADLNDLGLSDYEAKVYRSLLNLGTTTASELSDDSGVPMGRVYDTLDGLENKGMARSQSTSQPKKYVAVEPETALERLVEEKEEEFDKKLNRYRSTAEELQGKLELTGSIDDRFWTAVVGQEDSVELVLERTKSAQEHILVVIGGFDYKGDPTQAVERFLEQYHDMDIDISVLLSPEVNESFGSNVESKAAELYETGRYEVRIASSEIHGNCHIIDGDEVCIVVVNPMSSGELLALVDIQDNDLANRLSNEFQEEWEQAHKVI
ncbi:MAG: helix-turn-helix domain-containing protein [Halobacteria archaeon]|nr:helix-turn-helix domain-containing protein [Halobacteria archaeon]